MLAAEPGPDLPETSGEGIHEGHNGSKRDIHEGTLRTKNTTVVHQVHDVTPNLQHA